MKECVNTNVFPTNNEYNVPYMIPPKCNPLKFLVGTTQQMTQISAAIMSACSLTFSFSSWSNF